jgi:phosphatidylglycerophosphate synthase
LAQDRDPGAETPRAAIVGGNEVRIWGMTGAERLSRIFARLKLPLVEDGALPAGAVVVARADWVLDESVVRALAQRPGTVLVEDGQAVAAHAPTGEALAVARALQDGLVPAGLAALSAIELGGAYNHALRKREPPVAVPLTPDNVRAVEKRLFQGSYKGVTDLVTKHVWPVPARIVTRWCALARITPNQVTFAGFLLVLAAFWLFWIGAFGWGLVCAWIMTFLDTVDGKLARVTLTSSRIGNAFDHGIDLIHPPFWWWAWIVGVQAGWHALGNPQLVLAVVVGGYVAQRIEEGIFLALFKVEMHAWRPFDSFFRQITARRNPNLILLTLGALASRPDLGMAAVAWWTGICLVVHLVQILQALAMPRDRIVSWLKA